MAELFGDFALEVSTLVNVLKPLIPLSLNALETLQKESMQLKTDGSVVTIADFAIQSLIMSGIHETFPEDKVIGEEQIGTLTPAFLSLVGSLLPAGFDPISACQDSISSECSRVWVIDPIDGTLGFVGGGHFAIATALLIDLEVIASITAWPRHSPELTGLPIAGPAIFAAVRGCGSWASDVEGNWYRVSAGTTPSNALLFSDATGGMSRFVRGVWDRVEFEGQIVQISMTKGFILACGRARAWVKCHFGHFENAWDVAPFELFVREAGGRSSTINGSPIEYTKEWKVADSSEGLVFTVGGLEYHQRIVKALRESVDAIKSEEPRNPSDASA
jgi:3'-phosphoadenosine 5'-phosphosulfate (PAPS) 3'-phosphatase